MEITKKNDVHYLAGRLDEFSDFSSLELESEPLKLNVGKIEHINSIGIRNLLAFLIKWKGKRLEYYECTPDFIGNLNVIPQLLGEGPESVRSFYVPYYCEPCKKRKHVLYEVDKLKFDGSGIPQFDTVSCEKCKENMELEIEAPEYCHFMT